MTFQEIAHHQQGLVGRKDRGAGSIGLRNPPPTPSDTLRRGKYSDNSSPIEAPWNKMPDGAFPFAQPGVVNTPLENSGPVVWTDVISMVVPNGYDGVIKRLKNSYNGQGFVDGSGQLIWRILQNHQAVRGYDNILVEYGNDAVTGYSDGIRLTSGSIVEFQVTNVSLATGGTQISCFLGGWYYPNKVMGR